MASNDLSEEAHWLGPEPIGSGRRVYLGVLQDLEAGRLIPGQRLIETDLAAHHQVGRNAVREALQALATRGVVDLSPNRSPAIRQLDLAESLEVLDVAAAMLGLAARAAALAYGPHHARELDAATADLDATAGAEGSAAFSRARRRFYRTLLLIGGNRELQRLFPAIGMHVIHAQYPLRSLREIRRRDYAAIADAVRSGAAETAQQVAVDHVDHVRTAIREFAG